MEQLILQPSRELLAQLRETGVDFGVEFALPLVFSVSMQMMGCPQSDARFWQDHLLRSMARTVGQFGLPEDAEESNREAEAHLAEVMQRRHEEIEAGADANTPDVISQVLLAGKKRLLHARQQVGVAQPGSCS